MSSSQATRPTSGAKAYDDVVTRAVGRYEILSAPEQIELWYIWRKGETALWASREVTITAREALDRLLGANFRLAISEAGAVYERRTRGRANRGLADDLRGEAYAGLSEAIENFDPERGATLSGFITMHVRRRLSAYVQGDMPDTWGRVARMASQAETRLAGELGRWPSRDEVKEAVLEHSLEWARTKVIEAGGGGEDADVEALARRKVVKQGTMAALERFDEVRAKAASPVSLDAPIKGGDGATTMLELLEADSPEESVSVVTWFLESLEPDDRSLLVRRFGLDGQPGATYEELGEVCGVAWTQVRERISSLLGRMQAPHAMFLSLDTGLEGRIEHQKETSASARLRARREAARS